MGLINKGRYGMFAALCICLEHLFLLRPHSTEASRAVQKRAAWSPRGLPNVPAAPVQERATTGSELPMCGFATAASSVSAPAASPLAHRHRT